MGIHTHEFPFFFHVGDHVVDGHFRCGPGGGGHGDDGDAGIFGGGTAFQAPDIGEFRVGDDDADGFGGIHGGTAADGHDAVSTGCLERLHPMLYVGDGRIGFDVGVDFIGNLGSIQQVGDFAGHKGFFVSPVLHFRDDFTDGTAAMIRSTI